jgi:hypothetical protein
MHSPWGSLYPIIEKTGWSLNYILWKVSYANIQLIINDQPNFKKVTAPTKEAAKPISGQGLVSTFNFE